MLIGIDVGTGGAKVSAVSHAGELLAQASVSYPSIRPRPGFVEQDPESWVGASLFALKKVLDRVGPTLRSSITAVSLSGPHHVAVLLDEADRPLRNAIMWNDQRSVNEVAFLKEKYASSIYSRTGNSPSTTWTLAQLLWLRRHEPEILKRTRSLLFMKDYVRFRLTGHRGTDRVDAQGALLFDINRSQWDAELVDEAGLSLATMPQVFEPSDYGGALRDVITADLEIPAGTPVYVGSADSATELLAAGVSRPGQVTIKYATAGNVSKIAETLPTDPRILVYENLVRGRFYWNSATSAAAASMRWFVESLRGVTPTDEQFAAIDTALDGVPEGSQGLIFTPFLNGERSPYWDSDLRSTFTGLSSLHDWRHMARAVMEGVTFSLVESAAVYSESLPDQLTLIGGGARSRHWRQITADVFGREVSVAAVGDSSYGTALIAGIGAGVFADLDEAAVLVGKSGLTIEPSRDAHEQYQELIGIYREVVAVTTRTSHLIAEFVRAKPTIIQK